MNLTYDEAPEVLGLLEYAAPNHGYNIVYSKASWLIIVGIIRKGQEFS